MTSFVILQAVVNGLIIGSIYALIACGLTLIFGVMNIINVAHGDFLMLAMYACYFLYSLFGVDPCLIHSDRIPVIFRLRHVDLSNFS